MIHYTKTRWRFLTLMFYWGGSVMPRALPVGVMSALACFLLMYFNALPRNPDTEMSRLMLHPNPFAFFLQLAALAVAFHTNSSYQRYWEARTHVQAMAAYWADGASHIIAFDELALMDDGKDDTTTEHPRASSNECTVVDHQPSMIAVNKATESYRFRAVALHYLSLLHAVAIQYLLTDSKHGSKLEILGGISAKEGQELAAATDQAYLVSHWINQLLAHRHFIAKGLPVGGPVLSRTWQLMYLGMQSYNQACKIEDTPFPFQYMQFMGLLQVVIAVVTPIVVAIWIPSLPLAVVFTFIVVVAFASLFYAACLMDTPFGTRPNDLPLLALHEDYVDRLRLLVNADIAAALSALVAESAASSFDETGFNKHLFTAWPVYPPSPEKKTEDDGGGVTTAPAPLPAEQHLPFTDQRRLTTSEDDDDDDDQQRRPPSTPRIMKEPSRPDQRRRQQANTQDDLLPPALSQQKKHTIPTSLGYSHSRSLKQNTGQLAFVMPIVSSDAALPAAIKRRVGSPLDAGRLIVRAPTLSDDTLLRRIPTLTSMTHQDGAARLVLPAAPSDRCMGNNR